MLKNCKKTLLMVYETANIASIATSQLFLEWVALNIDVKWVEESHSTNKTILDEFTASFPSLNYHSHNDTYSGDTLIWFQDTKEVRKFAVSLRNVFVNRYTSAFPDRDISNWWHGTRIVKIFYAPNEVIGDKVLELLPIDPNNTICWCNSITGRYQIYYETELAGYDLILHSLLPHWSRGMSRLANASLQGDKIYFKGLNREDEGRFYHNDYRFEAYFDLLTGQITILSETYERDSYK
jgi:hypothetical protein